MLVAATSAATSAAAVEAFNEGKELVSKVKRNVEYANDLESNFKLLMEKAEKLYARKESIVAEANKHKTKQFTRECEVWISSVMKSKEEVQELKTKYDKEKTKSSKLKFLKSSRAKLSKRMVEKCDKLHSLWVEGNFERVLVEKLPERVRTMNAPKIEDKPSLYGYVEEILGLLRDRNVRKIGLWGMAGIGKTTIMKNLNNNEDIAKMFDIVIWVPVSKDFSVGELQRAITDRLKLNMEGITTQDEIAWRISLELECKRYLLLLDEVCETLDLDMIGILDNQKDSKVVLATRNRNICRFMSLDESINVKRMSSTDAWKMFIEKVGPKVNLPGIKYIAEQVVDQCSGLPLLIDKVASTFRKKDNIYLWKDGLRSLKIWPNIRTQGMDELIEILQYCYKDLECKDQKDCFLYGALYPEECEVYIDYLLECWRAEGFIYDVNEFRDARGRGHTILDELIGLSLLEKSEKMNHVRMNKVLRNMAVKISFQSDHFKIFVKVREGLKEPPNALEWHKVNRISLMDNKLCTLPESPSCNNLSTLLLQKNRDLEKIPDTFFEFMQNLRVLDLHDTRIALLPSSISRLTCLRALYLNSCIRLTELPDLDKFEHLEVLDIRGSGINQLPIQISCLVQLKCLRMSLPNFDMGWSEMVEFHRNVFSSLSLLEELMIDMDPNNQRWEAVVEGIIKGVATLTRLTSLSICFPNVNFLEYFISASPSWNVGHFRFQFFVGCHDSNSYKMFDHSELQRYFKFVNGEGVNTSISKVLEETDVFELVGHKGASNLSDFGIESINKMRVCLIEGCDEIETIVDGNTVGINALKWLEMMRINNVSKLESIWEGPIHAGSLSRLSTLTLWRCAKLKKIFSNDMIEQLFELEHLNVEECHEIEEIITKSENRGLEPEVLPKLKTLVLSDLPKVKSICTEDSLKWLSLKKIKISMCQLLKSLPFNNENATNLRCIEAHQSWWSELEWKEDTIKQRLQSICIFN
ncbi:disease resistance protein At4g27190-like [Castanea sativa]|uniref:disease resistance protein At4g27190-like n=1 Tax=Castanea sativa TaxID=21020 RepID=UPI003F652B98